jgi:hypothetical protein
MLAEMTAITTEYEGWTLTEIRNLSPRERKNWLEIAKYLRKD